MGEVRDYRRRLGSMREVRSTGGGQEKGGGVREYEGGQGVQGEVVLRLKKILSRKFNILVLLFLKKGF